MCEKIKWGISGLLIGMGVAAIVVATNKKVHKSISDGTEMATEKFNEVKDAAAKKIKTIKKSIGKPKNSSPKQSTAK